MLVRYYTYGTHFYLIRVVGPRDTQVGGCLTSANEVHVLEISN
jgi:hypothetical protein